MSGSGSDATSAGAGRVALIVNGEPYRAATGATALDVVSALGLEGRPIAVEVNERVVPRKLLAGCMLTPGDRLEIVTLVGGG